MSQDTTRSEFSLRVEAQLDALYGVALRLTRNTVDAEDLVAEAVAKAWYNIDKLDDWDCFRAWLFRILRNHFISGYRKTSRGPEILRLDAPTGDDGDGDLASVLFAQSDAFLQWWADPEKTLSDKHLGEQIKTAIGELPEVFRMTILLVNVDGLSYDEAAAVLDVPPGTVRSRMKRGRTLLQKALWEQAQERGLTSSREYSS